MLQNESTAEVLCHKHHKHADFLKDLPSQDSIIGAHQLFGGGQGFWVRTASMVRTRHFSGGGRILCQDCIMVRIKNVFSGANMREHALLGGVVCVERGARF